MKKDSKKKASQGEGCVIKERIGTVGGQALLEGIMMKSKEHYAVAVRLENGDIQVTEDDFISIRKKYKILNIPIVRGIVNMIETMKLSMKTLSISAEAYGLDTEEAETKFDKWINRVFGKKLVNIIMTIGTVLGVALGVLLFVYAPVFLADLLAKLLGIPASGLFKSVTEGVLKYAIFILYLVLVSKMKDIRRTFEYHGAEHKSIFCYENGEELTVENVKKYKRFHPRCGTSFIVVMLFLSIVVSAFIPGSVSRLLRTVIKLILLLPVSVGLGYEFIMYAGKHDNAFTRIVSQPGLWMQRITTKEPDAGQIECAIVALKTALPEVFPDYKYENPKKSEDGENAECTAEGAAAEDADNSGSAEKNAENPADSVGDQTDSVQSEGKDGSAKA